MWQCSICGREFKHTNQDHYCLKPNSIDEYIAAQPDDVRPLLHVIRATIRAAAPEATEKISWQMPTFWQGENPQNDQVVGYITVNTRFMGSRQQYLPLEAFQVSELCRGQGVFF